MGQTLSTEQPHRLSTFVPQNAQIFLVLLREIPRGPRNTLRVAFSNRSSPSVSDPFYSTTWSLSLPFNPLGHKLLTGRDTAAIDARMFLQLDLCGFGAVPYDSGAHWSGWSPCECQYICDELFVKRWDISAYCSYTAEGCILGLYGGLTVSRRFVVPFIIKLAFKVKTSYCARVPFRLFIDSLNVFETNRNGTWMLVHSLTSSGGAAIQKNWSPFVRAVNIRLLHDKKKLILEEVTFLPAYRARFLYSRRCAEQNDNGESNEDSRGLLRILIIVWKEPPIKE